MAKDTEVRSGKRLVTPAPSATTRKHFAGISAVVAAKMAPLDRGPQGAARAVRHAYNMKPPGPIKNQSKARNFVHCAAVAATMSLVGSAAAQERLPGGDVVAAPRPGVVAAWYARPTGRYGHGVLGDAVEGGSLVVRSDQGAIYEAVLPNRYVFEDVTPRLADLDGDGKREIVTIRTDVRAGAAVAIYALSGKALVERAATNPIGRPNRWVLIFTRN